MRYLRCALLRICTSDMQVETSLPLRKSLNKRNQRKATAYHRVKGPVVGFVKFDGLRSTLYRTDGRVMTATVSEVGVPASWKEQMSLCRQPIEAAHEKRTKTRCA